MGLSQEYSNPIASLIGITSVSKKLEDDQNLDPIHKELIISKSRQIDSKCPVCDPLML